MYLTQAGYYCHEKHQVIIPFLDAAQFWIEGIFLTIFAIIGLFGNLLTIVVLLWIERGSKYGAMGISGINYGNQSSFNAILICLVTFDSFFLVFSLFDSGFMMSNWPEPYW